MKKISPLLFLIISFVCSHVSAIAQPIDSLRFFTEEQVIQMTISTDIKSLQAQKGDDIFQPGTVTMKFPDSTTITEPINVGARGKFRRGYCRIPPMMINFRQPGANRLSTLGKLKMVIGCGVQSEDEQLLLKEFMIYKIYNIIEEKSFRVRLLRTNYIDTRNKVKPFTQYSFLIEDDGDLARRTGCKKKEHPSYLTENTNRETMTMVAIFEYMIGNTDWSVPNGHNVKLIFDKNKEIVKPYVVPYDFDYCGLVDASYAVPNEIIGTEKVTERVYRGIARTLDEVQSILTVFKEKKAAIFAFVNSFTLVTEKNRRIMIDYLEEFYKIIDNQIRVKSIFVDNVRTS